MKFCRKCKRKFPATIEFFYRNGKHGLRAQCKKCQSKAIWAYRKKLGPTKRREYLRKRRAENPDKRRNSDLKNEYGITLKQYNKMAISQNGVCAICGNENISGRTLAVDHCHKTNKIRGLLCHNCNTVIGLLKENKKTITKILKYLKG